MRPAISSNEMNESCSLFIERFVDVGRVLLDSGLFRCWHEKVSERPPIREIIEYFKSKQGPVVPRDIRRPFIESVTPNSGMKTTVSSVRQSPLKYSSGYDTETRNGRERRYSNTEC